MGEKEEDVFSDSFDKKSDDKQENSEFKLPKEDEVHDVSIGSEPPKEPKKDSSDDDWDIPDKQETSKPSRKKAGIIGAVLVIGVMIGIVYASGIITTDGVLDDIELGVPVPDQPADDDVRIVDGKKPEKPKDEPFKDFSSASDKVIIEKTNDPIGYYLVTTNDDWYGDFVDIRKIPSKIEKSGNLKINFRCYTDDFQGTSTYFGTFRNVIDNDLTVEVYINGLEVESQSTNTNKALILEGSCYGHES